MLFVRACQLREQVGQYLLLSLVETVKFIPDTFEVDVVRSLKGLRTEACQCDENLALIAVRLTCASDVAEILELAEHARRAGGRYP